MQRGFQFLAGSEMVALQHVFDTTVEALDHAVCLGRSWRRQAVFDIRFGAELVELMVPALRALAQAKETVGELLPIDALLTVKSRFGSVDFEISFSEAVEDFTGDVSF
jgi:hypothetical protein